jgi:acetyl esterase/lipase
MLRRPLFALFSQNALFSETALLTLLSVSVLGGLAASAAAQDAGPRVPPGVVYEADVVIGKGGETELALDIARPEKLDKPAPCIVFVHGGGWRGGNRKVHVSHILDFAKRGYVVATISYRLVPTARFPAQVEDVKCAIRYLRANAEKHQLDPNKIGAVGFSAGAHLAMLLGTMDAKDGLEGDGGHADQSSKVQAVVAFFGPTELGAADIPAASAGMVNDFLGSTKEEDPEIRKTASPITYVDQNDAPLLIYQGTKDRLVPHTQAFVMADAMTKAGMPGRVELLIGADHGWAPPELTRTVEGTLAFFAENLK